MAITLLANAFVKRGYEVEILCTYNFGEPAYTLSDDVIVTYLTDVLPNRSEFKDAVKSKNIFKVIKEGFCALRVLCLKHSTMKSKIKEIKSGVVIATRNDHAVLLSKYGRKGVKKIAQLHHDHGFNKSLVRDFEKHYNQIDTFIVLTEKLKNEIEQIMSGNNHTEIKVIPNFLTDEDLSQEYVEQCEKQIVAVGRMHEVKGFLRLLDIWKKTRADNDIVLKLIGDGEQFDEIKAKISALDLEDRVVMTGALSHTQVIDEMNKSIAYVMTSFSEAFPFVLLEAMSSGLPIIAYDVRVGPEAIIEDGKTGYLIEDGNEEQYCDKLESMLRNREKRNQMSLNAFESVKKFSESTVLEKWKEIIN